MKKLFLLSVAALVTFAACQKEINPAKQGTGISALTATVEQQVGDTKTALGNSNSVVWSEGDVIKVWNASNVSGDFTLTEGAGTTQGTFNGEEVADPLYAFYPASAVSSVNGSVATFTLPATQNYIKNTFDNGANIAVAKISGNSMQFKNVCGVLKLQLKGTTLVKSIVVTGKNNEKLNGTYTVNAGFETEPDMPCVTTETASEKSVTLDCGTGVFLDPAKVTNFYIVVPKGAFANGFDVTVKDKFDATDNILTSKANTINRNTLLSMPEKGVKISGVILPGVFSVSATEQVRFASGNLQATVDDAGTPTDWFFADQQYTVAGASSANSTLGTSGGTFDMFGFSSDGAGAGENWKPWGINHSKNNDDYAGAFKSLTINPDVQSKLGNLWDLLSVSEMKYLMNSRSKENGTASSLESEPSARWAPVCVNGINGLLIFPDVFEWSTLMGCAPSIVNKGLSTWDVAPTYSLSEFACQEAAGCVFLPCSGERSGGSGIGKTTAYYDLSGKRGYFGYSQAGNLTIGTISGYNFMGHLVRFIRRVD